MTANTSHSSLIKDPNKANERIFVGNLPPKITKEELESICVRYGNIICSMVQKNFGFVQFDCEETANKAASALHGSTFKGNRITVRNAANKPKPKENQDQDKSQQQQQKKQQQNQIHQDSALSLQQQYHATISNPEYNDCEIIVINKQNTEYAEYIESRLRRLLLKVDILFPNEEVAIGKVLANISSRGCLYAVLVTPQNQEHRSITVNILYGQPAEHRNMPIEDAITLISTDFEEKLKTEKKKLIPLAVPIIPPTSSVVPSLKERHPEAIQTLLSLLAENMPLTVLQYDHIIKYLSEKRELQVKAELGDAATTTAATSSAINKLMAGVRAEKNSKSQVIPDPEIQLQKKMLNIMSKTAITDSKPKLVYPDVRSLSNDSEIIELLKDSKVQLALDSLMSTPLVASVKNHFEF